VEAERLVDRALALIPAGDYDPHVAGRRGKTLATLASFLLEWHDDESAKACLIQARDAHDLHRQIPAHSEALVECVARLCQLEAFNATDKVVIRQQFDKVKALPELTPRSALVRAACLVNIARDLSWGGGEHDEFRECAERLLDLVEGRAAREPLAAMLAHLRLAEAHGVEGGFDAAWQHYRAAQDLIGRIPGIDPAFGPDEAIELVLGLLASHVDTTTGFPYRDVDRLIRQVLADIERQTSRIRWGEGQRDWLTIRLACTMAMHAANTGALERYSQYAQDAQRRVESHQGPLPDKIVTLSSTITALAGLADVQDARRHGLGAGQDLSCSLAAPARPRFKPTPCHHFDVFRPPPATPPESAAPETNEAVRPELTIDRARSVTLHGHMIQHLLVHGDPADTAIEAAARPLADDPQGVVDHLIGAWRIIDTLCHRISRITEESIDNLRRRYDDSLIRSHHDTRADTVPTRMVLRCLNNDWWYPEFDDILRQLDLNAFLQIMKDLVHLQYRLASDVARLTGGHPGQIIAQTVTVALAYDSTQVYRGERTYDPEAGTITIGRDILGEPQTLRLHPAAGTGINHIWILGGEGAGKSSMHRLVTLQASITGVYCVFPADPRDEHNFTRKWEFSVPSPAWIATNVSDTLDNLEVLTKIINVRSHEDGYERPTHEQPGILFAVDDADDILVHPRGRALFERIVLEGPAVCVGLVAVIRDMASLDWSERILKEMAFSTTALCFGHEEFQALSRLRDTYRP